MAPRGIAVVVGSALAGVLLLPAAASADYGSLSTVSVRADGTATGNAASINMSGSAGGRTVAFQSQATDIAGTGNNFDYDVFVRNQVAGGSALVSHAAGDTAEADGASTGPIVSGNGQYVAYVSEATNVVSPPVSAGEFAAHVYLYDKTTGTNLLVDHAFGDEAVAGPSGAQVAAVSWDGRYVVYTSASNNLVGDPSNDTNADSGSGVDVFVYDRTTRTSRLVSHSGESDGVVAANGGDAFNVYARSDAGLVTFSSIATDISPGATSGQTNVYLWRMDTGATRLVSHVHDGTDEQTGASLGMDLSEDGGYLLYESDAGDAVAGQSAASGGGPADIFLYDVAQNDSMLVSHAAGAPTTETDDATIDGNLSADGAFAAWSSPADGVIAASPGGREMVYEFARSSGVNTLVSHASSGAGTPAGSDSTGARVSPDGGTVAYESDADDLVPAQPAEGPSNVFAWDRAGGGNLLVSHTAASSSTPGSAMSWRPRFAGPLLLFQSDAPNLASAATDGNSATDVFAAGSFATSDAIGAPVDIGGGGGGTPTTTTTTTTDPGGGTTTLPGTGTPRALPTLADLLAGLRAPGPCHRRVLADVALVACGGNKKASPNLRVYMVNARATALTLRLAATEALPRNAAAVKKVSYASKTIVVPASGSATATLRVPAKLRKALAKALKKRAKVTRRPLVTMTGGGLKTSLAHSVTMRRK
jgi:hypothetical protein